MKMPLKLLATAACCVALAGAVQAFPVPLQGRDINGNPVAADDPSAVFEYDANLNLTWLRDWNYAGTAMDWATAMDSAATLTVGAFGGWALPTSLNPDGTGPCSGYYCVGSPMGYMHYTELGNGAYDASNPGPFLNVQSVYWTDTTYAPNTSRAWFFVTVGAQSFNVASQPYSAVAVRPGDVAADVPEPQTLALTLLALGAAVVTRRRRPARPFG